MYPGRNHQWFNRRDSNAECCAVGPWLLLLHVEQTEYSGFSFMSSRSTTWNLENERIVLSSLKGGSRDSAKFGLLKSSRIGFSLLSYIPCRQDKMKAENLSEAAILAFKNSYAALVSVRGHRCLSVHKDVELVMRWTVAPEEWFWCA